MVKKYIVNLSAEKRAYLEWFTTMGRRAADQITRARILRKADRNEPVGGWRDKDIAAALDVRVTTGERMRRRFVELGLETSLVRQPRGGRPSQGLNGEQEAHLIVLNRSEAPTGHARLMLEIPLDTLKVQITAQNLPALPPLNRSMLCGRCRSRMPVLPQMLGGDSSGCFASKC